MPRLLSRIEREYVLKHMAETLPALSVRYGDAYLELAERSYTVDRDAIHYVSPKNFGHVAIAASLPCEVRFSHRKRALSFASIISAGDGLIGIAIPEDFYKSADREAAVATCRLKAWFPGLSIEFRDATAFPLGLEYIDPEDASSSAIAMHKVVGRLCVEVSDRNGGVVAHRLKEYFDCVRTDENPGQWTRTILYVDESAILLTIEEPAIMLRSMDAEFGITIDYGARRIECVSRIAGTIPVKGGIALACLSYADIKPEDRRFLHEKAHSEKFIG